ncbi:hypothetical protein SALWKB29_0642 [Snodgrassella communis]|uniref:Uncharacterized protein n=1 Tax=Snodgrassella communis TaxID=2946699 RepID=A0A836MSM7_9NEIS|nr:hypothetical protein SALWKB29_0642 [Snodgrassella communis]
MSACFMLSGLMAALCYLFFQPLWIFLLIRAIQPALGYWQD